MEKTVTLSALKAQLTREVRELRSYLAEVQEQKETQHPQPNGAIYLHGEVVAWNEGGKVRDALHTIHTKRYFDRLVARRNAMESEAKKMMVVVKETPAERIAKRDAIIAEVRKHASDIIMNALLSCDSDRKLFQFVYEFKEQLRLGNETTLSVTIGAEAVRLIKTF